MLQQAPELYDEPWSGRATYHVRTTPDGVPLTSTIAKVHGHGVRVLWRSPDAVLVTVFRDPIAFPEADVPGAEVKAATIDADPAVTAAFVLKRLVAMSDEGKA
jgi:hypothetical protein